MKITRKRQDFTTARYPDWHIITVAEVGFSMLSLYSEKLRVDRRVIHAFADKINKCNEAATLFPVAPLSAMPRDFFRNVSRYGDGIIPMFKRELAELVCANNKLILAPRLIVDFHVSPTRIWEPFLAETERVLQQEDNNCLHEVVIFDTFIH